MSNSKPNSLIHYVDFNSSKMKGSKRPLIVIPYDNLHFRTIQIVGEWHLFLILVLDKRITAMLS